MRNDALLRDVLKSPFLVMKSLLAILSHQAHILLIDYGQTIRLTNQANDRVANVFSSKSTTAGSILALASYMT